MINHDGFFETVLPPQLPKNLALRKTATVVRIADDESPILVFDGEETPSQQKYINAREPSLPKVGDRVVLLGAIGSNDDIIIGWWTPNANT